MNWSRIFAQLAKLAAVFIVVPAILMARLRWDSILPIIIYLQLLLIWVQAEISLRQTALFAAQFEPAFVVKVGEAAPMTLAIENVSENPAYDVSVGRLLDEGGAPYDPKEWQDKLEIDRMAALAPHEKHRLCAFKDETLRETLLTRGGSIEVLYLNRQGEWQSLTLRFLKDGQMLIVSGGTLPPGVLLRTIEDASSALSYLRLRRYLRRKGMV
jgi:hypothetical protein